MGLGERIEFYKQIEGLRKRPLIVYVTSQRSNAIGLMAGDVIPEFIDQLQRFPKDANTVDLLIESAGGDPLVAWRIMSLFREKAKEISVLIPSSAFSAATLMALGGNEIIMGKYGCLGPIDPQTRVKRKDGSDAVVSFRDFVSYLDFYKNEAGLTEQAHTENAFKLLVEHIEPWLLGQGRRASSLAVTIAEKLLQIHMTGAEEKIKASSIAKNLNESYFSHGHAVGRTEAKGIGLNIQNAGDELEELMWKVHLDIEKDLNIREPFNPVGIFLSDPQAEQYLKSPPPIYIPPQIPQQIALQLIDKYFQSQLNATIPDVSVELTYGLVESARFASASQVKSKILLTRTLDLKFIASKVDLQSRWRAVPIPKSGGEDKKGESHA
ncbi:MAG: hypothetical protein ABSB32_08965 [Thermodesulfobacteriota bacterium]